MSKPFASSADTLEKTDTLEVLADGVYALTAEGDPNVGAVEGEDFVVAIESRATPAASRDWLKILRERTDKPVRYLVLTHYHAVRVLGASAFDAQDIVMSRASRDLVAERGLEDWKSEFGRMPRLAKNADEVPGLTWPTITFETEYDIELGPDRGRLELRFLGPATPAATSSSGTTGRGRSMPATSSSRRRRSTPATPTTSTGPAAPSTTSRPTAPRT